MDLISVFPLKALTPEEWSGVAPFIVLSFGAVISLIVGTDKKNGRTFSFLVSLLTLALAFFYDAFQIYEIPAALLGGALVINSFTKSLGLLSLFFSMIALIITYGHDKKDELLSEVYSLILFATAGMMLMICSNHLIFTFIALEIMSLAVYVMVAMRRTSRFSAEAGLKYFILGGLASALLLYGTALVYGALGTFEYHTIATKLATPGAPSFIYYIGLGLILAAMLFKVGAFPFHGWVPDVYQGASSSVTGFMGASVKFTAFMALASIARSMVYVPDVEGLSWFQVLIWFAAAGSMIYGNFVAISQTEIKRMLSFSSIAHTGYLLMSFNTLNASIESSQSLILYLFFYAITNLGAFAVISLLEVKGQKDLTLDQIAGLGMKSPLLGGLLTIFLLSMAGIPLTAGFIGKYGLFYQTVSGGEIPLAVIAVLTSVVSVYYYLRVIVYLFMKDSNGNTVPELKWKGASIAALFSAAVTLQFGVFPKMIIQFVKVLTR